MELLRLIVRQWQALMAIVESIPTFGGASNLTAYCICAIGTKEGPSVFPRSVPNPSSQDLASMPSVLHVSGLGRS